MAIDLITEQTLHPREAAPFFPSNKPGKDTHPQTVVNLITIGKRVRRTGETIRLEGLRIGSHWITSKEAIQRFAERLTAAELGQGAEPAPKDNAARERELARVDRELAAAGF